MQPPPFSLSYFYALFLSVIWRRQAAQHPQKDYSQSDRRRRCQLLVPVQRIHLLTVEQILLAACVWRKVYAHMLKHTHEDGVILQQQKLKRKYKVLEIKMDIVYHSFGYR